MDRPHGWHQPGRARNARASDRKRWHGAPGGADASTTRDLRRDGL